MGHARKILGSKQVAAIPKFQSNKLQLEVAENFHLHFRNFRFEFDHVEFRKLAFCFIRGYTTWLFNGRPASKMYKKEGDKFLMLGEGYLPAIPSFFNDETKNTSLRVELQEEADYVHLHYKEFRFDFSIDEFTEFANVIKKSLSSLEEIILEEDSPRRTGLFHRTIPFNRVDKSHLNNGKYWLIPEDVKLKNKYESSWTENDKKYLPDRKVDKFGFYKVDIRDLFEITLYHSSTVVPWAVDEKGIHLPLKNRYEFAKKYISENFHLSEKQIKQSNYFKLLLKQMGDLPRDGQSNGVYHDPAKQVERFKLLIKSIYNNGYSPNSSHCEFNTDMKIVNEDNGITDQKNRKGIFAISVYPVSGGLRVHNGLHRLAILKVLFEIGRLKDPLIKVQCVDNKLFKKNFFNYVSFDNNGFPNGNLNGYNIITSKLNEFLDNTLLVFSVIPTGIGLFLKLLSNLLLKTFSKIKRIFSD